MNIETVFAVLAFAAVTSITPGPNNLMLLASGVSHGLRATVPHILGISVGFTALIAGTGLGLGAVLEQWPQSQLVMRLLGGSYMVWLAWQLWHAEAPQVAGDTPVRKHAPMGFWAAAAFQWINPKAWMMALGAVSAFTSPQGGVAAVLALALICAAVNLPCITVWALGGARLSRQLGRPASRRLFNAVMAVLLLLSIVPMVRS